MKNIKIIASISGILLLSFIIWFWLDSMKPLAKWCKVELPDYAVIGEDLPIRIYYYGIEEETRLGADMHFSSKDLRSKGFLSHGGPFPNVMGNGEHIFNFQVKERIDLDAVYLVIFLSDTGNWKNRTMAALTKKIPILLEKGQPIKRNYKLTTPFAVHQAQSSYEGIESLTALEKSSINNSATIKLFKIVNLLLYLTVLTLCIRCAYQSHLQNQKNSTWKIVIWLVITLILVFYSTSDFLNTGTWLTKTGREFAIHYGLYYQRQVFQKMITTLFATAGIYTSFVLFRIVRKFSKQLSYALIGTVILICVSVTNLLSFHYIDDLFNKNICGIQIYQLLKSATIISIGISSGSAVFSSKS